jgi:L-ascorbate metabolism protein UlaG (beta-lactamase superfamily)
MNKATATSTAAAARASRLARKIASPQWQDGKFRNGLPETTHFSRALAKLLTAKNTKPSHPIPTVERRKTDFEKPPQSGLRVTWVSHSSLLVEIEGRRFLTDPVWGERASPVSFAGPKRFFPAPIPLNELPQLDAVVLSHDHYDHFCKETLEFFARTQVPFIVPLGVGDRLEDLGVHHSRISEFDWWEELQLGPVKLACVPARHFSGRTLFDRNSTLWCGWAFIGANRRFYFSGDTAYFPGFKMIGEKYGPFDIVAIESAAYNSAWPDVHIGPEQAIQACLEVKGQLYLPIHWATFNLSTHSWTEPVERLIVKAKSLNVPLVFPKPGESVEPGAIPKSMFEKWWPELAWETAEQAPVISTGT